MQQEAFFQASNCTVSGAAAAAVVRLHQTFDQITEGTLAMHHLRDLLPALGLHSAGTIP